MLDKLENMKFKDIEKYFNQLLYDCKVGESSDAKDIKSVLYHDLKNKLSTINIQYIDYHYNKFEVRYEYVNDFNDMKGYDKGHIDLIFAIQSKRTDKLETISKTRKKYIHIKHDKPIKFCGFVINSYVPSFDWESEAIDDIRINGRTWSHSHDGTDCVKGESINELLEQLSKTYLEQFKSDIVQPYVKQLMLKGKRYSTIYNILNERLKNALETGDKDRIVFPELAELIVNMGLIVKE